MIERGQVYFARSGDLIKIGYSSYPEGRMWTLPSPTGDEIDLLGTISGSTAEERSLHERFSAYRAVGEWFTASSELVEFIDSNADPKNVSVPARKLARQDCAMLAVSVEKNARRRLKTIAFRKGLTVQAVIRGLMDQYIEANEDAA